MTNGFKIIGIAARTTNVCGILRTVSTLGTFVGVPKVPAVLKF
jgi:hypothetical protein